VGADRVTTFSLDALFAQYDAERNEQFLESHVFSTAGAAGIGDVNVGRRGDRRHETLVIRRVQRRRRPLRGAPRRAQDQVHAGDPREQTDFSDTLSATALVGFAEANHENPVQTTLLFDANNIDGYSFDYRENSRLPLFTYGTTDVTNAGPGRCRRSACVRRARSTASTRRPST
jgi:hypothetical protein